MSQGTIFEQWRAAAGADWARYTRHAFVQKLGDGSLPRACFMHYLAQDYLFLKHFSRAWALAITKADTIDEMRHCAATVHSLINEEMRLHVETCARAGLDELLLAATEETPANIAYTRYVLDAGHAGDLLDLLAALAPCVMGYGEIGRNLAGQAGATPYREWIETYAGADYQASCTAVGALIDDAVRRRLGETARDSPRWTALCRRFATATRLEIGFWDMGLAP